ncbi:hypothetical protein FC84_GL001284 [Lapidilactobacillus dextrinicus DSM 20335]|uniref:Uncharacterized protein n=1 Tax=Lapidilactobacillus dextrinicus DSM 20335 TaxID=1423738 RepID=A0A0R2BHV4_9LACO|nr:hypothetical protein FC84_GL001284 [Lapidilactobacillus dextrinicus DSM 20335]
MCGLIERIRIKNFKDSGYDHKIIHNKKSLTFLTFWQFDWLPALLITGLTVIGWTLGLQLAKLKVKYADMIKREN